MESAVSRESAAAPHYHMALPLPGPRDRLRPAPVTHRIPSSCHSAGRQVIYTTFEPLWDSLDVRAADMIEKGLFTAVLLEQRFTKQLAAR